MTKEELEFSNQYQISFRRRDQVHALVAWFNAHFEGMGLNEVLSTSPFDRYTHWKQTVFYLKDVLNVENGDELRGSIAVRKSRTNFREVDVKISGHFRGYKDHSSVQMYKLR